MKRVLPILLFFSLPCAVFGQGAARTVSPLDYGLREATTGIGRYYALYNAHVEALRLGAEVSYAGIDSLELELPPSFKSIPLGRHTDFGGLVIRVTNNVKHGALFALTNGAVALQMDKATVDGQDYTAVPELARGLHLLLLKDRKPWTERRGFGYMAYRSDVVVVRDGRGQNRPVMPWNTDSTQLGASYCTVDDGLKEVRGLTMHRTRQSTFRTYCLSVTGQYNVLVEDMHVTTPRSKMIADGVFSVSNSAKLLFRNITVDGTYSGYGRTRNYGYAFSLNNVYDSRYEHIRARGNWGVFGSNNMSRTELVDCDIDRFDIHCYGRDVTLRRCYLHGRQTIFGSMYGTVLFDSCTFEDYVPVRIRSSYNAYTPFDIVMHDCTYRLTLQHRSLVSIMLLDTAENPRPELREKCWPNLYVDGLTVVAPWPVGTLNIYDPIDNLDDLNREIGYLSNVSIHGLKTVRPSGRETDVKMRLFSHDVKTKNEVNYTVERVKE